MKLKFKPSSIPAYDDRTIGRDADGREVRVYRNDSRLIVRVNRGGDTFAADFKVPLILSEEVEVDLKKLRKEWVDPKGADVWEGPSPLDVRSCFREGDLTEKDREADRDPWAKTRFTIDGVEVEIETRQMNGRGGFHRRNATRYGVPRRFRIEKVSLKAGGYSKSDQRRRAMKDLFKRDEWESELFHKFEECREFAFDHDQASDASLRRRRAFEARQEARRASYVEAKGDRKFATGFGHNVPEKLTIDVSKVHPLDLPDVLELIDVLIQDAITANPENEKVSE